MNKLILFIKKLNRGITPISILGILICILMIVDSYSVDIYKSNEIDTFKIKISELRHIRKGKSGIWAVKSNDSSEKYSIDFAENENKLKCYIRGRAIGLGDSIEIVTPKKYNYKNKSDFIPILGLTIIEKNTSFYEKVTLKELNEYNYDQICSSKIQFAIACFGIFIILLFMWRFRNMPNINI